ncbi:hypothetical protein V2G26_016257 [Clonostachys chloroleuca]
MFGAFYWTENEASCIIAQPIKPVDGAQPSSFWAEKVPAGRCVTMAFAPNERHIIVCQGPDVPLASGSGDVDTRRHGQMGKTPRRGTPNQGQRRTQTENSRTPISRSTSTSTTLPGVKLPPDHLP